MQTDVAWWDGWEKNLRARAGHPGLTLIAFVERHELTKRTVLTLKTQDGKPVAEIAFD